MNIIDIDLEKMWNELVNMVNAQFESVPFQGLLSIRFTNDRARNYMIQMTHYVLNRRDCWGFVQGAAPLEVKRLIWEHEQEELMGDQSAGKMDHITLSVKEGEVVGLKAVDFDRTHPIDGAVACFYAWIHLARDRTWLESLATSSILEMRNSDGLVRGGALSKRIGKKMEDELSIPFKKQINAVEHVDADVRHANLLMQVAHHYANTKEKQAAIIHGAEESLIIDRVYRSHLGDMLTVLQ